MKPLLGTIVLFGFLAFASAEDKPKPKPDEPMTFKIPSEDDDFNPILRRRKFEEQIGKRFVFKDIIASHLSESTTQTAKAKGAKGDAGGKDKRVYTIISGGTIKPNQKFIFKFDEAEEDYLTQLQFKRASIKAPATLNSIDVEGSFTGKMESGHYIFADCKLLQIVRADYPDGKKVNVWQRPKQPEK